MAIFRGWYVVWAAFAAMTVIFGVAYSFAAFFQPWSLAFGAQRADVSWVFGLSSLLYFAFGAVGGALADRFGPRATGLAGMSCLAIGLLLSSMATSLSSIYLAYGLGIGLGIALVYTPSMGAVQPWFTRQRGLASGIASSGIGAGTLIVPVVASWLIAQLDWREAMRWMALGVLVFGYGAVFFLDRDPTRHNLAPDGSPAGGDGKPAPVPPGLSLGQAVRTPTFRWFYAGALAAGVAMFVPFAHLSAAARDAGIAETRAVGLVGLIGIGSLLGRFGIGVLADRFGRLRTHFFVYAVLGASFVIWALASSYLAFALFGLLFGLSYGGLVSLMPPICTDLYGVRAVSGIIGVLYTGAGFGALVGPVAAGALFDITGNYDWALLTCGACSAVATFCAWRLLRQAGQHPPV
ncbi:MAG: MFS transporter [Burkholderiaceae bacterium]